MLAAGAGVRAGGPKALRRTASGTPWVEAVVRRLFDGGCTDVVVVLGAAATAARALLPASASAVVCERWADGLSESLRTGIATAGGCCLRRWRRRSPRSTSPTAIRRHCAGC
ncbi:MAG: NTP transferase domain-containing protein [Micropruina sp.]